MVEMSVAVWTILAIAAPIMLSHAAYRLFSLEISFGNRNAAIDGTRGFLALAVVVHHFMVSTAFTETGVWEEPDNVFFRNVGPCAVSIFFMITAYLFYGKILNSRKGDRKWVWLYMARFARLTPMYLVAVTFVVITAFAFTGWVAAVPLNELARSLLSWAIFTLPGSLPINGFQDTKLIIAGVTWSLRYEWVFYICLPVVAMGMDMASSRNVRLLVLMTLGAVSYALPTHNVVVSQATTFIPIFAFGMIAFEVSNLEPLQRYARQPVGSCCLLACLVAVLLLPLQTYGQIQVIILAGAFTLVCSGATLFGGLTQPASRLLGEATYGIYLFHGIALFWVFQGGVLPTSWGMLPVITVSVTAVSLIGYYAIEKPAIQAARQRKVDVAVNAFP